MEVAVVVKSRIKGDYLHFISSVLCEWETPRGLTRVASCLAVAVFLIFMMKDLMG